MNLKKFLDHESFPELPDPFSRRQEDIVANKIYDKLNDYIRDTGKDPKYLIIDMETYYILHNFDIRLLNGHGRLTYFMDMIICIIQYVKEPYIDIA